ncbi:hypothetical protein GLOIN_2v1874888 [Rhizophagus irregularis DAOM 181602=DAOM 197198]|nr:hypothetical protein GLOIN_2v1874888 [Rhizophagus irregularis DAOM 181602=DAOM 197198]
MDLYVYNLDEYTTDSRQGNEFAPSWPFRLAVAGSSDSGKTTMIINLLMGDKKAKEDGERYILCDAVILVGRYLDEPKWAVVRDFFQRRRNSVYRRSHHWIFLHTGVTKNISCIYVAQRFFTIPKAIRENVNYISLHGGHGSLTDTKRIIRQYTGESESLAPVIDDLTLQREFIVFDLRRSKSDPLSIRVRWDTSLSSITDQSQFDPSSNSVQSPFDPSLNPVRSKFSPYGQKAVAEAKKLPKFLAKVRDRTAKTEIPKSETVKESFLRVIWTVEHYE